MSYVVFKSQFFPRSIKRTVSLSVNTIAGHDKYANILQKALCANKVDKQTNDVISHVTCTIALPHNNDNCDNALLHDEKCLLIDNIVTHGR